MKKWKQEMNQRFLVPTSMQMLINKNNIAAYVWVHHRISVIFVIRKFVSSSAVMLIQMELMSQDVYTEPMTQDAKPC